MDRPRYVFLFPRERQIGLIAATTGLDQPPVIVIPNTGPLDGADVLTPAEFVSWAQGRAGDSWMCCTEVGVYFAARHRKLGGQLGFSPRCLDMLTKLDMSKGLSQAGLSVLPKQVLDPEADLDSLPYPLVAKPNFGFASSQVQRVRSRAEMESYLKEYPRQREQSVVRPYQNAFFDLHPRSYLDQVLIEPDHSEATFLSVPFVTESGEVRESFPVDGLRCSETSDSHFVWTSFRAPSRLPGELLALVEAELRKLVEGLELSRGVFEAEMLVELSPPRVFVLEFSPRVIGGSLPDLLRHALGFDLEVASIDLFLGRSLTVGRRLQRSCLLRRDRASDSQKPAPEPGALLSEHRRKVGDQVFVDRIWELP